MAAIAPSMLSRRKGPTWLEIPRVAAPTIGAMASLISPSRRCITGSISGTYLDRRSSISVALMSQALRKPYSFNPPKRVRILVGEVNVAGKLNVPDCWPWYAVHVTCAMPGASGSAAGVPSTIRSKPSVPVGSTFGGGSSDDCGAPCSTTVCDAIVKPAMPALVKVTSAVPSVVCMLTPTRTVE